MGRKENGEVNMLKKILGFIPRMLYNILIIFCVLLIVIIVMQRLTDSNRSIKGYKIFKVVSGSMVPKYDVGEVVICKETPVEDIKIGNAIVYRGKLGDLNGRLVMHEVIAINHDENNELKFYARGLNNSKGDPEISESQILGVVKLKSKILTVLYRLATSIYSAFIITTILVINVFVSFKSGKVTKENKDETEEQEELKLKSIDQQLQEIEDMEILQNEENKIENNDDVKEDEKTENKTEDEMEEDVIDLKEEIDKIENVEKVKDKTTKKTSNQNQKKETKSETKNISKNI